MCVCVVSLRVFACISTWALEILKRCFINEPQIGKVTVYLVIFKNNWVHVIYSLLYSIVCKGVICKDLVKI